MRIWYLICLILFIESISILINERYDVTYHLEYDPNWDVWKESTKYLGCFNLVDIHKDKTELKLNQLSNKLLSYYLNNTNQLPNSKKELVSKKINSGDYYFNKYWICLIGDNRTEYAKIESSFKIEFILIDNQFMKYDYLYLFSQIIIYNLESPYSNCKMKSTNKFDCINKCLSSEFKLFKSYHRNSENETINFNDNSNEIDCIKECNKQDNDCKLIFFKEECGGSFISIIFKAYPVLSKFDYWIQFIGLICFFTDLFIYYFLTKLIKLIDSRIKIKIRIIKIKRFRIKINIKLCLIWFKFIILLNLIIYLILLFYGMICDYQNKRDYPIRKQITTTKLEPPKSIDLIVCVNLNLIYNNTNYKGSSFQQLENYTSKYFNFTDNIKGIYLEYQNKKIKINYRFNQSKILFIVDKKCIQLDIHTHEFKYQNQLLITKLIIEFKYTKQVNKQINYETYLLSDKQNFNYKSHRVSEGYLFSKIIKKRSKLNKVKKCNEQRSKYDLINECIIRKFIDHNQNLYYYNLVIDKDQFSIDEWTKFSIDYNSNNDQYKNLTNQCEIEFANHLDCYEIEYKNDAQGQNILDNKYRIDLYHDIIEEIEEEPSIYKLLMDILNIQSILFGLNIFKLITILFDYKIIKFKYNNLLIYLLCSIGFSYHLYFIFNEIINGDLIYSQYYELEQIFKMPNLVFCIKYQNLINPNHQLTYKYLDKITNEIDIDSVFYELIYLNNSNNWIKMNKTLFNQLNINTFYFLDKKCFDLKLDIVYKLDQFKFDINNLFYYSNKNKVIRFLFNDTFTKNNQSFFMTKLSGMMKFSKLAVTENLENYYSLTIELFEIDYNDKFNLIKNPLSILYSSNDINDADKYLSNLIDNYRIDYNLVTLNLPLNNSDGLEIDDQLFDQFYLQIQNLSDYNQPNLNYHRIFIKNYHDLDLSDPYLSIYLFFFKKIIKITNEDNYTKLILNLLNLVSLWFDLSLFDLEIYFDLFIINLRLAFIFLYESLIKIDNYIYRKL